jgi:hypothetical protein
MGGLEERGGNLSGGMRSMSCCRADGSAGVRASGQVTVQAMPVADGAACKSRWLVRLTEIRCNSCGQIAQVRRMNMDDASLAPLCFLHER